MPARSAAKKSSRRRRPTAKTKDAFVDLKTKLARAFAKRVNDEGMTQGDAARRIHAATGVMFAESQVSLLCTGKIAGFSVERLLLGLNGVGVQVNVGLASPFDDAKRGRTIFSSPL
jgi:predicted XRE-type DNA-binding protein